MKGSPLVFLVLFLCLGLAAVGSLLVGYSRKSPQPAAALALATMQATSTPEPSMTPVPTVDYSAVWPAETQAAAADDLANAQERIARAASTQAQATRSALDSARQVGTPTALEMTRIAQIATEQAQANAQAAFIEQETAKVLAAIETDKKAAERADLFDLIWKSAAIVAGCAIVVILVYHFVRESEIKGQPEPEPAREITPENFIPASDEILPAYPGGLDTRLFAAFLSPGTLRKAAGLVGAGVPLIHDNFTPIAKCMSEGQFTKLQNALVEYRAATWNDDTHKAGITLTEKGVKFFADLQTTPLLNQYAPKTTPPAVKQSIDDGFQPMGEGEGSKEG